MTKKLKPSRHLGPEAINELLGFTRNIKAARKRRKITRAEMSARTRVSPATLARLESGDPTVSLGATMQVLSVLGLSRGLAELIAPENDVAQTIQEVRNMRLKKKAAPKNVFKKEELDF